MPGFNECVFDKGATGLIGVLNAEVRLRHDVDIQIAKNASDLTQLSGVATGHDNFVGQLRQDATTWPARRFVRR